MSDICQFSTDSPDLRGGIHFGHRNLTWLERWERALTRSGILAMREGEEKQRSRRREEEWRRVKFLPSKSRLLFQALLSISIRPIL